MMDFSREMYLGIAKKYKQQLIILSVIFLLSVMILLLPKDLIEKVPDWVHRMAIIPFIISLLGIFIPIIRWILLYNTCKSQKIVLMNDVLYYRRFNEKGSNLNTETKINKGDYLEGFQVRKVTRFIVDKHYVTIYGDITKRPALFRGGRPVSCLVIPISFNNPYTLINWLINRCKNANR